CMGYQHELHRVYLVVYHLLWCPMRRRKVKVLVVPVRDRLKQLIGEVAADHDGEIIQLANRPDHVHLFLRANPSTLLADSPRLIKGPSSHDVRVEGPRAKCGRAGPCGGNAARWGIHSPKNLPDLSGGVSKRAALKVDSAQGKAHEGGWAVRRATRHFKTLECRLPSDAGARALRAAARCTMPPGRGGLPRGPGDNSPSRSRRRARQGSQGCPLARASGRSIETVARPGT